MKRASRARPATGSDLQPEYDFDYSKARPNPYAARLQGRTVTVVLDPDVAKAFPTSESVNRTLRAVVAAIPRRAKTASGTTRRTAASRKK